MTGLAFASLRHRLTANVSTFLAVLLGSTMIGSFATLAETATGPVSTADADTLTIMGMVVGGWGSAIVLFSVASTLAITVRQRETEIGLLRAIGATTGQARRLVRTEAAVVAAVAATLGACVASVAGRALLALLREGGLVSSTVEYGGGVASVAGAAVLVVATSLVAATLTARKATRGTVSVVLRDAVAENGRMRWYRILAGVLLVGYGLVMATITVTVTADSDDPYAAMATSGSSAILVGVGLALFSPVLLRVLAGPARWVLGGSASGHLASSNAARRTHLLAGVLAPVIVLTATTVGTLMLVSIDGRTLDASLAPDDAETINLLNNVVVGMISLFAAIMVVNAFAAVISHRRAELQRLWLVGATAGQVQRSIVIEAAVVATVGVVLGTVASLATILPFAHARDEGLVPDGGWWLPPLLIAGVVLLTIGSARGAVRPAIRSTVRHGALSR